MARLHSILAALLVVTAPAAAVAQTTVPSEMGKPATFTIFVNGATAGSEEITSTLTAEGWTIRSSGRIGVPVNLTNSRFEVKYDREWKPLSLEIDAAMGGQPLVIRTTVVNGKATSTVTQAGQLSNKTDSIAPDAILLPNRFFGAVEALALRLSAIPPGTQVKAYVVPQAEITISVTSVTPERIHTPARMIDAKRYNLAFANPGQTVAAEVWTDENSRLLRFRVPAQGLEIARDDVAAMGSRVEQMSRRNDEQVRIPAAGFTLVGTISRPVVATAAVNARWPTVVLVAGAGISDRDEMVAGIAIFAQLANAIADAGFLVVRYDKRGVGQSGGRGESANLSDYADDVKSVLKFLEKRKDVDIRRVALVGHSEGGFISLTAATEDRKKVAAVALLATPGTNGAELTLEQQQHVLGLMTDLPDAEKQQRMDMQRRIQAAVVSGKGWEAIPPSYRRQADTMWFRSFLEFDPLKPLKKLEQPVLILQGDRDRQVPVRHAQILMSAAEARKKDPGSKVVIAEGVNHLLEQAVTGEVDEYPALQDKTISQKVTDPLVNWLKETLHVDSPSPRR